VRVVVAEDFALLREGLVGMLSARGFDVVAAVDNAPALRRALAELSPDVALVDVRLPPTLTDEGLRAALEARERTPGLPVLVLSQYVEQLYARELLADGQGAVGYLLKDRVADAEEFIDAVRRVAAGGTVMDPQVIAHLVARPHRIERLTDREREVLALMAEGRSHAAIGQRLVLSEGSIAKHTTSIFAKLGLAPSQDDHRRVLAVLAHLGAEIP